MNVIRHHRPRRQRGMGIVETMVGILIGMVVVLAIYNVFALAEGYKRTTVGVADAQTTGLVAQFILAREIGNAGNGISVNAGTLSGSLGSAALAKCAAAPASNWPAGPFGGSAIRPIPVLIEDGGANKPDRLVVTYGSSPRISNAVLLNQQIDAGNPNVFLQSPNGFRIGDWIVVSSGTKCQLTRVANLVGPDINGIVELTPDPAYPLTPDYNASGGSSTVTNLGCDGKTLPNCGSGSPMATRTLFDVVSAQLRTTDLFDAGAVAVPIAQNIVLLKAQYGVDCLNNGVITWTSATAAGACAWDYRPDDLTVAPAALAWDANRLARIRAVRIAIVVRSDEPDLKDVGLVGQKATLFDCSTHDAACQGSIAIDKTVLADGWRHRTYETIIPLRNAIYNHGS